MKEKLSIAAKCFAAILVIDFLCFFMFISFNVIAVGVGTTAQGYVAYKEVDGELVELYTHYYADGEDTKIKEYEEQGIEVKTSSFRSEVSPGISTAVDVITILSSLSIMCAMIYSILWRRGDKDNNLATFGHIERDKMKGLKVGLLAVSPMALLYILLWVNKFVEIIPGYSGLFKIANYYLFPLVELCFSGAQSASEIPVWGMLLLLLTLVPVPALSTLGYYCGNSEIVLTDKIIYVNHKEKKK